MGIIYAPYSLIICLSIQKWLQFNNLFSLSLMLWSFDAGLRYPKYSTGGLQCFLLFIYLLSTNRAVLSLEFSKLEGAFWSMSSDRLFMTSGGCKMNVGMINHLSLLKPFWQGLFNFLLPVSAKNRRKKIANLWYK